MTTRAPFPSLRIAEDALVPQGAFAEAQAEFLSPDEGVVRSLDALLEEKKIGVVAHFYMDPELQGVLSACAWPHVGISDSLKMAESAIAMVEAGCEHVVVLGVDFMSENVRAMLDAAGHADVPVYRAAAGPIGCSLAESAEAPAYRAYLEEAARAERALHVVYINTSLLTKARAHALVPTITSTSSIVVRTLLTAFAEIPDVHVYFGPDTYMGHNLLELFRSLPALGDEAIRALHPAHDRASVESLLPRLHCFEQGNCVVHHMFGDEVARRLREDYPDVLVAAHLEVPGEMFRVAMERQRDGDAGVAGSTSDILAFIDRKLADAIEEGEGGRIRVALGTEAGMITSIVERVRARLRAAGGRGAEVEIIFPVAAEAITRTPDGELPIVPGADGGEGCSTAGGCATCPYMKMNSLDALLRIAEAVGVADEELEALAPHVYEERVAGRAVADLGREPILHMRDLQREGRLPAALVEDVIGRPARRRREGAAPA